ncbi:MAG: hypothetical protein ACP5NV_02360 [Candidatus Woesearchaeota archaeon]
MHVNILKANDKYFVKYYSRFRKGTFQKPTAQELVVELKERIPEKYLNNLTIYSIPYQSKNGLKKVHDLIVTDIVEIINNSYRKNYNTAPKLDAINY